MNEEWKGKAEHGLFQIKRPVKWKFLFLALFLFLFILWITYADFHSSLRFSKQPGYYDAPFSLQIQGGGQYRIFYTLDGSKPTQESIPYEGEIYLEDASNHENVYSARTDTSTAFYTELVEQYSSENPGYTVPDYKVDKCNIVRACAFDQSGNCVDSITGSYFIGFSEKAAYNGLWTVSLITDPDNLFGFENGIYVTGKAFEEYKKLLPDENTPLRGSWWWWTGNYSERGKEAEREANIEIRRPDRSLVLAEECGIRVQGNGSRGKLPKSLSVYARREYSGSDEFSADIFGIGDESHKFVLFSGADDSEYKLKDYMVNTMEAGLDFCTMDFLPAALFLDGEFWGVYYITESYHSDYFADHYGVSQDEVIVVKEELVTEGKEEEAQLYLDMREYIAGNDMAQAQNFEKAQTLMDMGSYIDYYAAQIFIGRSGDWPKKNEGAWRTRSVVSGSEYADGRWRWLLYDVNSGGLSTVEEDTLAYVLEADSVFASLIQNAGFKERFAERLLYMADEVYSPQKVDAFIDSYLGTLMEPLCLSNLRFNGRDLRTEKTENAERIRAFLKERPVYIEQMIANHMGPEYLE